MIGIGLVVRNSREAAELYTRAFGLELGYHVLNEDGSFFHSELSRKGEPFLSVVEGRREVKESPVQLGVEFDSREALENALALLRVGGRVVREPAPLPWSPWAAEVNDPFGVNWYLSLPQHRPEEDSAAGE